jgi:uncharacterized protein DUF5719
VADQPRIRPRAVAVVLMALVVVATGVLLDRAVGARPTGSGSVPAEPTGAWFCPHGGSPGWHAWVVVTNPGPKPVRVRLTQTALGHVRSVGTFTLGPLRQVYREVSAEDPADVATVEYFGGWVGVAAIVRSDSPAGVAAERCEPSPRHTWFLLDQTTGAGDSSYIVVMNPFAADANFDLVTRTEHRKIAPGVFSPFFLKARSSVAIRVNDFALEEPGEQTVAVEVTERTGRVVVGGFVRSAGGIRAETGGAEPAQSTVLPAAGFVGQPDVIMFNPQTDPADVSVLSSGRTGQRVVSGATSVSLGPDQVKTIAFAEFPGSGAVVRSDNKEALVATMRVTGPSGDPATVVGTTDFARSWLVMPSTPPSGGKAFLVIQNPGRTGLKIAVQFIGPDGMIVTTRFASVLVPPGKTTSLALAGLAKGGPVSAVVRGEGGTFVAAMASYGRGGVGYAVTLGLPMKQA